MPHLTTVDFSEQMENHQKVNDLNAPGKKLVFNAPPKKKKGAKFRMHPFKVGNMTVALTNFDPMVGSDETTNGQEWYCTLFLGTGKQFSTIPITDKVFSSLNDLVGSWPDGSAFQDAFKENFGGHIGNKQQVQSILEQNRSSDGPIYGPATIVEELAKLIEPFDPTNEMLEVKVAGIQKEIVPKRQLLAMWSIHKICSMM